MSEEENELFKKCFYKTLKKLAEEPEEVINYNELLKKYNNLLKEKKDLQQKVEQLEKENKKFRQPQVFIDCEDMEERYSRDLYEDYLKEKIERLENIRKEAIEYVENNTKYYDADYSETYRELCSMPGANDTRLHVVIGDTDLLNILNKGSDKE